MAEALDPVYASEDPRLLPRHMAGEQELAKVLPRTTLRCDVGVNSSVTRTAPFGIGSQQAAVCRLSVAAAISDKPGGPSPAFVILLPVQKRAPFLHATAVGWSMPLPRF
jgi:hypothetical protein